MLYGCRFDHKIYKEEEEEFVRNDVTTAVIYAKSIFQIK